MDLRKERTLKNLSAALLDLLQTKTLEQISVSEVCEAAMVRRATFYRHFKGKTELFEYVVANIRKDIQNSRVAAVDAASLDGYCHAMTEELIRLVGENRELVARHGLSRGFAQEIDSLADAIADEFAEHIAESRGLAQPTGAIRTQASFYAHGLIGAVRRWVNEKGSRGEHEEDLLETLRDIASRMFS